MKITGLGHASAYVETARGSVLCDPWVNPAYFGSWFPFPDNSHLDWELYGRADYLYISHLHRDHFDPVHLRRFISSKATVLLPDYPTDELHDALYELGFRHFVKTRNGEVTEIDGLAVMIEALISPTDGPIGDSSIWLHDGTFTLLNQNDARPTNLGQIAELGPVDAHLLQYSGAIWYPMVYDLPERAKKAFGAQKRARQFDRTIRYIDDLKANYVYPIAGPPCFLDDELWHLNDIFNDEGNIFPDQKVFEQFMLDKGYENCRTLIPGATSNLAVPGAPVEHPISEEETARIFREKETYLHDYRQRKQRQLDEEKARWSHDAIDIYSEIKPWFEEILAESDIIAGGVGGPVRFTAFADDEEQDVDLVIDFPNREVREYENERCRYQFRAPRVLVEHLVYIREIDWVNSLFLSCRFSASRVGQYNEYVYVFFKCLSVERMQYAEGWFAEQSPDDEDITLDEWVVQRRCPHLKADLSKFGQVDDGVLTCQMHGWKFDLETGKCLTSTGFTVRSARQTQ
ncbi:MAG: Rieske 2Fe-2S domain-containing protein [Corynebacteriales bacterium]|nr:Rieske 2Fe-2S domain-containing protein [Mycobacteriales bacterium]